ncbi:MAG: helix-turn-helix domain-containing protein [Clostridia bacterium]|nr:helix-turn-helix domain-containing protein [Clostridia bacterium]
MYAPSPFGVMLKEMREQLGLSQDELAEVLNKTAQYISNMEKGKNKSPPDDSDIQKLISRLELDSENSEKFRMLAYADRGMLPPELFNYVSGCPPLIGVIRSAMKNNVSPEYWVKVLNSIVKGRTI